jgi:hypothetical protein
MVKKIIVLFLVLLTLGLLTKKFYYQKWLGYETIPDTMIFDEHDYPAIGYTFRKTGVATGWSTMNIYKILESQTSHPANIGYRDLSLTLDGQKPSVSNAPLFNYPLTRQLDVNIGKGTETIIIVQPFLDHPVLGSYLFSLNSKNPQRFDDFYPADYRVVALIAASITAILLFGFTYLLYGSLVTSFLSFILYSTVTTYVIISRFALFENLLVPFYLLSGIFLLLGFRYPRRKIIFFVLSSFVAGLSYLIKETGIFILLSSLAILIYQRYKLKDLAIYFVPCVLVIGSFYLYSLILSPNLTLRLLFDQAQRGFFGSLNFIYSIYQPRVKDMPLEGYWLWGFISLIAISTTSFKKHAHLLIGFFGYLFIYFLFAGENYAWYSFPFAPFFIIASAVCLTELLTNPTILNLVLFFALPLSSSMYWGYMVFHQSSNLVNLYRLIMFGLIGLFVAKKRLSSRFKFINYLWVLAIVVVFYQVYKWNFQGFTYMIANWGKLPRPFFLL